jgi:hypothetical protein
MVPSILNNLKEENIYMYALIKDGKIDTLRARPDWYDAETNLPLTDEELAVMENLYRVDFEVNKPTIDDFYQYIQQKDKSEWEIDTVNYIVKVTYEIKEKTIEQLYEQKRSEIISKFNNELDRGVVESSLGFPVDARRSGRHNDKDNVQTLINMGQEPVQFKCADNQFRELTLSDLQIILNELSQKWLWLYQHKFEKENALGQIKSDYDNNVTDYLTTVNNLKTFIVW